MVELARARERIAGAIHDIIRRRVEMASSRLLENPEIRLQVERMPALKHILAHNIAKGVIPETGGEGKARELIEKARVAGVLSGKLSSDRPVFGVGRPPAQVALLQQALRERARTHELAARLSKEKAFSSYLSKMALVLHKLGNTHQELAGSPALSQAVLDHIAAEYQLMKEAGVPPSIIKKYGHSFTVFHADDIYKNSHKIFGRDAESEPLVRTAAVQVFMKKYESVEAAKKAYDSHLIEAKKQFGRDAESEPLVRTAAFQVFMKKYESVEAAKKAYDLKFAEERARARKVQIKDLVLPELAGLQRDRAVELLKPIIERIGHNFSESDLGTEDAEQAARLSAIELLETGERNSEKILDTMIGEVTKQAAIYAAYRINTRQLPPEK